MNIQEQYMQRCIDLALKGAGQVSPNPMVGAVLVYNKRIIGEGWHEQYGQPHAEVNCIASVSDQDRALISKSTLYVSLEPCAHYGKTPPCADLIIQHNIHEVIIGCTDSYKEVSGKGIQKLKAAGVSVTLGVLEKECRWLNRRFFTRQELSRPYIILKWAQSDDAFIAPEEGKRFMLSNTFSQKMVQKMRSEEDAILVGYNTALLDNPKLNNRYGSGKQPIRIVIDPELKLSHELQLFDQSQHTIVFNYLKTEEKENISWVQLTRDRSFAQQIIEQLKNINSIIIEGGSKTLQAFIDEDLWDEAVLFQTKHILQKGTKAPQLKNRIKADQFQLQDDTINIYHHEHTQQLYRDQ
jgi:diaminohydroxyphosphoribosylaminopyrimidine deaminase / 5-amino-6-(5-phosphoribosylamino)uracil reductase